MQIKRDEKKPFYSARVKFSNSVHMRVATERMRYFKLTKANGQNRQCRFLPFVQSLSKVQDQAFTCAAAYNPETTSMSIFSQSSNAAQSENFPDNSHL